MPRRRWPKRRLRRPRSRSRTSASPGWTARRTLFGSTWTRGGAPLREATLRHQASYSLRRAASAFSFFPEGPSAPTFRASTPPGASSAAGSSPFSVFSFWASNSRRCTSPSSPEHVCSPIPSRRHTSAFGLPSLLLPQHAYALRLADELSLRKGAGHASDPRLSIGELPRPQPR